MATVLDLIEGSLRLIEELGAGQTASSEDANDAFYALNSMLETWSIEGDLVYTETTETFTLTANDGSYTMGSGGDFNTARPIRLLAAVLKNGNNETPLSIYNIDQWAAIPDKTIAGIPSVIYMDNNFATANINLYPVPSTTYSLVLYTEKPLTAFTSTGQTLSLPPGYERALRYNLAVEIAPEYGKEAKPSVMSAAVESKNLVKNQNNLFDNDQMIVDEALTFVGAYNIFKD